MKYMYQRARLYVYLLYVLTHYCPVLQELLAYAITNMGSSFFSSFATSASLSRSLIQEHVGGVTQVSGWKAKGQMWIKNGLSFAHIFMQIHKEEPVFPHARK